jgi:N-acetylmuramoyl-L-alanine amidase
MDQNSTIPPFDTPPDAQVPSPEHPESPPERQMAKSQRSLLWGSLQTVGTVAFVMATLFTLWNPANLFSNQMMEQAFRAWQSSAVGTPVPIYPTITAEPFLSIGIVAGHYSADKDNYDPGAVCEDGLTEENVNFKIAYYVYQKLSALGYQVDLLQEFDPRLSGYRGQMLVSIHNDSCEYMGEDATGFKVASAVRNAYPEEAERLTGCLIDRYGKETSMDFHFNTITADMTDYHTFNEINSNTPAAIIETGFLNLDRTFLLDQTDKVAQGIVNGILCYMNNEKVSSSDQ